MRILITNDDGYKAKGIKILARLMSKIGEVTVIGPKKQQSGMGLAVDLGFKQIAYKDLGVSDGIKWSYLDGTPASCIKFGINFMEQAPDVVVSGINHGANTTTGACYSGTLGACQEAAINGIPAIGVSIDNSSFDADFSAVEKFFPEIFMKILTLHSGKYGVYYNVNFPKIPADEIKGIRMAHMGIGRWIKEFTEWDPQYYSKLGLTPESFGQNSVAKAEEGEKIYMMIGQYKDSPINTRRADHYLMKNGYITITIHNIVTTDFEEVNRFKDSGIDINFP